VLSAEEIRRLAEECAALAVGGQVQAVSAPGPERFVLEIYRGRRHRLLLCLVAGLARFHFVDEALPPAQRPPPLLVPLRAHLDGRRLASLRALPGERILRLEFEGAHAGMEPERRILVAELFESSRNLFLLDGEDRILARLRSPGRGRAGLVPGGRWLPPPGRAGPVPEPVPFAFLPAEEGSLSRRLERHAATLEAARAEGERRKRLRDDLARRERRETRHVASLAQECARLAEEAPARRRRAELFQIALSGQDPAARSFRIRDPEAPDAAPLEVELLPGETPGRAVGRLFREAERMEADWSRVSSELGRAESRLQSLVALLQAILDAEAPLAELEERARELMGGPVIPAPAAAPSAPVSQERLPYRIFLAEDGTEILVGRTAADNDELTFRIARGSDLWLHAADHPGSHVIVRAPGEIPEQALLDAAALAAHFSKAPPGARVAVSWTRRKHVRKFRGAAPGQVQLAERRTLVPRDREARLARLLGRRPKA
jgi:predicted ribosome quality control (RQC) complex YloA/Tae2 family protein